MVSGAFRARDNTIKFSTMNNVMKNFGNVGNTVTSALHLQSSKDSQHPSATGEGGKKSNRISIDVDESYKVFTEFRVNLNHLATLYKTEHELMKSLNENGLYTAKCYQKMLAKSPLQHIVASTIETDALPKKSAGKKKHLDPSESSDVKVADSEDYEKGEFVSAAVGITKSESVDDDKHESHLRKMEPEEVLEAQDYNFTKTGIQSSYVAKENNVVLQQGAKKIHGQDPPSKESLVKKKEDLKGDAVDDEPASKDAVTKKDEVENEQMSSGPPSDAPSESEFPNDEQPGDEVVDKNVNFDSEGVNVMMGVIDDDDDDSFTHDIIDDDDDSFGADKSPKVGEGYADSAKDSHDGEETKNEPNEKRAVDPDGEVVDPEKDETSDLEPNENDQDNERERNAAAAENDKKDPDVEIIDEDEDVFSDVELIKKVEPSAPELKEIETHTSFHTQQEASYFDVHKQVYKETSSYLKKHSKLVDYAEDWEKTVTTRVQSMHAEYQKLRKGLNHYIGKVDALENEKRKSEEKNREMPPKRLEKLERNRTKLMGTRKSHDVAGIDLIILIDEIVNRSWRDAFPLLQKSVTFETDLSSMQAKLYGGMTATATMLDQASRKESISSSHRLLLLKNSPPEELNFHKFKGDWD